MRLEARTAFCLHHVGAALRASPVHDSVGVYVKDEQMRVVLRKFLTPRQHDGIVGMCGRLLHEAEAAWEAMTAPQG